MFGIRNVMIWIICALGFGNRIQRLRRPERFRGNSGKFFGRNSDRICEALKKIVLGKGDMVFAQYLTLYSCRKGGAGMIRSLGRGFLKRLVLEKLLVELSSKLHSF